MKKLLISLITVLLTGTCYAQATKLLQPFTPAVNILGGVMLEPSTLGQSLGFAGYYDPATQSPPWEVAQWGTSSNVLPAPGSASGWMVANASSIRVQFYSQIEGSTNVYELGQANDPCGNEMDLILQKGERNGFVRSQPISSLGSITIRTGLSVPYGLVENRCAPIGQWDYAHYIFAFVLSTADAMYPNQQTLFYQIGLGRNPSQPQNPSVGWCPEYELNNSGNTGNTFCLDDDVRNFGGTWVLPYTNTVNNIEVLPRLLQVLAMRHAKANFPGTVLDPDPSHWKVTGVYAGQIIEGGAISTTRWYDLDMSTMPGGTFCFGGNTIQWSCSSGQPSGSGWVDVGNTCYHRDTAKPCF